MGREHAPRVVYHVFSMSFHLFFVFRKGGQLYMGVPCTGVRPCMAVPHKKLHIGSLLHHPNGSLCTDCVPQGLLTLWVAYVNTYLLSFNRGDSHAWGFHAKLSGHAKLSPMRNHTSQICDWAARSQCGFKQRRADHTKYIWYVATHGQSVITTELMIA